MNGSEWIIQQVFLFICIFTIFQTFFLDLRINSEVLFKVFGNNDRKISLESQKNGKNFADELSSCKAFIIILFVDERKNFSSQLWICLNGSRLKYWNGLIDCNLTSTQISFSRNLWSTCELDLENGHVLDIAKGIHNDWLKLQRFDFDK